jgi:predicted PurR-regulated permease PerM
VRREPARGPGEPAGGLPDDGQPVVVEAPGAGTQGHGRASVISTWLWRGMAFSLGVAIVLGTIALGVAAGRVLLLVFVAVILAAGLEPVIAWLRGRLGLRRGVTILLVYGAFLLTVVGLAAVIFPAAAAQFGAAAERLPVFLDQVREWASGLRPGALGAAVSRLADAAERLLPSGSSNGPSTGEVVEVGLTVVETVVTVVTILTVVYYWLVEHARLQRYVLAFVPADRRAGARDTWNEVETRLGLWVRGQLILMATIGLATGLACFLLGVPGALLLGLIAAVTEAIPLVGPILGAIPAIIMAATVSPQLALLIAGVYIVLQVIENNVLVPVVMRNTIGISPFLIILSLLVGGAAGGLIGALLAVPVAAAIELIVSGLQSRERPVAQDPAAAGPDDDEHHNAPDAPDEARSTRVRRTTPDDRAGSTPRGRPQPS